MDDQSLRFPTKAHLRTFVKAHTVIDNLREEARRGAVGGSEQQKKVAQDFLSRLLGAAIEGFPSTKKPTFSVKFEGSFGSREGPVMAGSVYDHMIHSVKVQGEGVVLSYEDFLGLSIRERGYLWQPIKNCLEALQKSGYTVREIRVKMEEDRMEERAWVYPATITIGM